MDQEHKGNEYKNSYFRNFDICTGDDKETISGEQSATLHSNTDLQYKSTANYEEVPMRQSVGRQ